MGKKVNRCFAPKVKGGAHHAARDPAPVGRPAYWEQHVTKPAFLPSTSMLKTWAAKSLLAKHYSLTPTNQAFPHSLIKSLPSVHLFFTFYVSPLFHPFKLISSENKKEACSWACTP